MPKRKRSSLAITPGSTVPSHENLNLQESAAELPPPKRKPSRRGRVDTNPDVNADIVDGKTALRASPDAEAKGEVFHVERLIPKTPLREIKVKKEAGLEDNVSSLSVVGENLPNFNREKTSKKTPTKSSIAAKKGSDEIKAFKVEQAAKKAANNAVKHDDEVEEWDSRADPDGDDVGLAENVSIMKIEAARPPPVNSDYLPLPWKGRLGYVGAILLRKTY